MSNSSDSFDKTKCYIKISDNEDHTFWLFPETSRPLKLGGLNIGVGFDLKPNTPMKEADELADLMRKYITHISVWID
jgi:hypothetical protein